MPASPTPPDRHRLLALLVVVSAGIVGTPATAIDQSPLFSQLSLEDGLSQTTVYAILQDRTGFMWFGTEEGLNRFDGHQFKIYKHDPQDPTTISSNWVWTILEDSRGRMWIGTNGGGLGRFRPEDETFVHYRADPDNPQSLPSDRVRIILEDNQGLLWVGTDGGGVRRFDPDTGQFTSISSPDTGSSPGNEVRALLQDGNGSLLIGSLDSGLQRIDVDSGVVTPVLPGDRADDPASRDRVRALFRDRNGSIWIGTLGAGLGRLDPSTGRYRRFRNEPADPFSLSDDHVRTVFQDGTGTLWVGTEQGLNEFLPDRQGFRRHLNQPVNRRGLDDDSVHSIYQDRGGVLWVGTQRGGLDRFNPLAPSFPVERPSPTGENGLSGNNVTSFAATSAKELWVGTIDGGLNRLDRESGRFVHFHHDPAVSESLSDDRVMCLLVDHTGQLWIGTQRGGLNRFDPTSRSFRHYRHDPGDSTSLSSDGVTSIVEDGQGDLWIGTYGGGVNRLNGRGHTFLHYRHDPDDPASIASDRVTTLYEDRSRVLWAGTDGAGMLRLDRLTGTFVAVGSDGDELNSGDTILSFYEDEAGDLWIGTRGNGLQRWSKSNRGAERAILDRFTEQDGLPNNTVYGILGDPDGNLWLSTNNGLAKRDRHGLFRRYSTAHGLQSNEFNLGAYYLGPGGEMFFGGINGYNAFLPSRISANTHVPPIVITAFRKANREVKLERAIWAIDEVEVGYRDYVVSFDFAALDYTAPEQNRYAYQLSGLDENWIDLGSSYRATYTNLDPGSYVLRVRGSNNDGVWNESGTSLAVRVLPPPWRTWWAYGIYLTIACMLLAMLIRSQQQRQARAEERRRELEIKVRERTRELEEASLTDALTGLRNRRYLMTHIHEDLALVDRYHRDHTGNAAESHETPRDFLFMMVDLDGLKRINDVYGHAAGDRVIVQMKDLLTQISRRSDTLVRLGGDEFLVVGRDLDRRRAESLAERLRNAVAAHEFDLGNGSTEHLSCSIGFAFYPFLPDDPMRITGDQVITIADRALYIAKSSGRNAWVGIQATDRTVPDDLMEMIHYRIEPLVDQKAIELSTSIEDRPLVSQRPE